MEFLRSKPKRNLGFTLIEVILTVVILGVIIGLSTPNFRQVYNNFQLKSDVESLVYLMRYAKSKAIIKNKTIRLMIDLGSKKYFLAQQSDEDTEGEAALSFEPIKDKTGKPRKFEGDIEITNNELHVDFYPNGTIDKIQVDICNKGKCFTISTKEQRGKVSVSDKWSSKNI